MSILDRATIAQIPWGTDAVDVIGLPAGTELHRVFRHDAMDWAPCAEAFRTGRLDPPKEHRGDFAVLYTAESLLTSLFEARALRVVPNQFGDQIEVVQDVDPALPPRRAVVHRLSAAVFFLNLEQRKTAKLFGLDPDAELDRIPMWQSASSKVFHRLRESPPSGMAPVAGLAHQSKIRGANGWNFGFYSPGHEKFLERGMPVILDIEAVCKLV